MRVKIRKKSLWRPTGVFHLYFKSGKVKVQSLKISFVYRASDNRNRI